MLKVLFEKDGRIGPITLNRPEKINTINNDIPPQIDDAVKWADTDPDIHVMVLSGAGKSFCAGYDLVYYAAGQGTNKVVQDMPRDPLQDYQFMRRNTQHFMSPWRVMKPVISKVHGYGIAGGSDIALCAAMTIMVDECLVRHRSKPDTTSEQNIMT